MGCLLPLIKGRLYKVYLKLFCMRFVSSSTVIYSIIYFMRGYLIYTLGYNAMLFYLFIYLFFNHLYWSIIASQYCVSFCCTTKWISYMHTYIAISPPSWASLPPSLSHPSRWSQSTELISLCYAWLWIL